MKRLYKRFTIYGWTVNNRGCRCENVLWHGFTAAFSFGLCSGYFVSLRTYYKIILMKKKPYLTNENTENRVEEAAASYGQQIVNVNDSVSAECQPVDAATCESNRITVSDFFDEIRTVLRKKYENV